MLKRVFNGVKMAGEIIFQLIGLIIFVVVWLSVPYMFHLEHMQLRKERKFKEKKRKKMDEFIKKTTPPLHKIEKNSEICNHLMR